MRRASSTGSWEPYKGRGPARAHERRNHRNRGGRRRARADGGPPARRPARPGPGGPARRALRRTGQPHRCSARARGAQPGGRPTRPGAAPLSATARPAAYPTALQERVDAYLAGLRFSSEQATQGLDEAMRYSLLAGGKRIRPVLALATAEALGRAPDEVLPFAAAIELVH